MSAINAAVTPGIQRVTAEQVPQRNRSTPQDSSTAVFGFDGQAARRADTEVGSPQREFVRVSSSIGRAATAGQLSRQQALDIYRQIASLL
jgi:hypothetical protein